MSKAEEYLDAHGKHGHIILDNAINEILHVCCSRMLVNKDISDHTHEWLCFNNLLELIRNRAMERLEKEGYFK